MNARIAEDTESPSALAIGSFRFCIGTDYSVPFRSAGELRALLNPVDCEYTLVLTAEGHKHMFRVTADEQVARLDPKPNEFSHYTKLELFSFFYTAETFTIINLVDLRARGRTTYVSDGTVQCNHPERTSYMQLFTDYEYDIRDLWLWVIQALECPLDCRYNVVLENATMPSKSCVIAPGSMPELIGLHNWDKITITDIRKAP